VSLGKQRLVITLLADLKFWSIPFISKLSIWTRRDGYENSSLPGAYVHYAEVGLIACEVLEQKGG
jgi:hypothetical protein